MECKHYLVSTNGNYFEHPDDIAMARLVKFGTEGSTVHFNYDSDHNRHWRNAAWQRKYNYKVAYPDHSRDGFKRIDL